MKSNHEHRTVNQDFLFFLVKKDSFLEKNQDK